MSKLIPTRGILVVNTFFLSLLLYIDRVCISAAKDPIAIDLRLTDTQMGWILSAFALGYAFFQVPSGLLSDKFGPRKILTSIVVLWSLFTAFTGAAWNYISMLVVRFLFGAGEAGAFPGISRAVYSWIPLKERGLVNGINFSGSRLGAAFALPFVAWLISEFGWRFSFVILGLIGIAWALYWYLWFRDTPEESSRITVREREYIMETRQKSETKSGSEGKLTFQNLVSSKNMWLAMGQYFASNFTFFFCLSWMLPHIKSKFQLDLVDAGIYAAVPLVFGAIGNWFSGWLVDKIFRSGKWILSRRMPAIMGFIFAAIGLVGSIYVDEIIISIAFLSLAIFGADMTLSPSWAFCIDIGKKNSGAVSGTMNMAGNIGSFVTALAFPYLTAWFDSVTPFFLVGASLNLLAVFLWMAMNPEIGINTE
ncbi:MAG: MFS transporter [Melioribacteraceae bacterium]|nr:MFS transporter [Melioribacteraceae bacterium]